MYRCVQKIALALLLLAVFPAKAVDAASPAEVKAAFIYNFLKFVDWPAEAFSGNGGEYMVGILGKDPFGTVLDEMLENKKVNGRPIVLKRITEAEMKHCHLLFVSPSERRRSGLILEILKGLPILTVSEMPEFAEAGGVINLFEDDKRIRFEVNIDAQKRAGLKIQSSMLNLAKIVRDR
jgi:hypothetical protein